MDEDTSQTGPVPVIVSEVQNGNLVVFEAIVGEEQAQTAFVPPVCEAQPIEVSEVSIEHNYEGPPQDGTTYELIEHGTMKGAPKLADSNGYTYVVKKMLHSGITYWRCSVRNKKFNCGATVRQVGDKFLKGPRGHIHPVKPGEALDTKLRSAIKKSASVETSASAMKIVNKVIEEVGLPSTSAGGLPRTEYLARAANRFRKKMRTQQSPSIFSTPQFSLNNFNIQFDQGDRVDDTPASDNFLRSDIDVDGKRHLIFASDKMLKMLRKSKTWYMNGYFKPVEAPYVQLLTIRAFVQNGEECEQALLAFALMSGKRRIDYKKVLKSVKHLSYGRKVGRIVADFDSALWTAIPLVFDNVQVSGCPLDFSRCIWRRIQELGLAGAYRNGNSSTQELCKQLMAIPYLPGIHATPMFENFAMKGAPLLNELIDYVRENWFEGVIWKQMTWNVFNEPIHTKNDVTNWQGMLQQYTEDERISYDSLVEFMREKAEHLDRVQVHLLSDNKLKKRQRQQHDQIQGQIFGLWESYLVGDKSAKKVLRKIASLLEFE